MKTNQIILNIPQENYTYTDTFIRLISEVCNRNLTIILVILLFILISMRIFKKNLISWIEEKIFGNYSSDVEKCIVFNEQTINKFVNFPKVKDYLFYREDSYFKLKYGSDFDPDYYDIVLIKFEVLEILRRDSDPLLKKIIIDSIKDLNKIRISLFINLISTIFLLGFFACFCILLNSLQIEYGLLKSIISLSVILFVVMAIINFFQLITKIEKDELQKNETKKYLNKSNLDMDSENDGLIVLEKQILK